MAAAGDLVTDASALQRELRRLLAAFDDDALAALANKGLLRRAAKDLEKAMPTVAEQTAEALVLAVGEHRVRLDRGGPAQAKCSCPATTTCQHVLTAILALQRVPVADDGAAIATDDGAVAPDATALHEALMAIDAEALRAHAGAQGHRWAVQFARDFDLQQHLRVEAKRAVVITLLRPHLVAHFAGGGVEALVVDGIPRNVEKHRAAVVLVYQRAHGRELGDDEAAPRGHQARLDLGADWTPALAAGDEVLGARARLCSAVQQLAGECLAIGLCHLSPHVQQRLATLAVWAQGAELPRLARLLRRVADHVDLLLQRAGAADEHRLFDDLAIACGLAAALAHAAAAGKAPTALVGSARSRFHDVATLELFGLGARTFRSPTGHRGLTMVFWSPPDRAFTTCTDARPAAMRGFDPIARYRQPGPWTGLGAPQQATGRRVTLTSARRDEHGRVAANERTHALVTALDDAALAAMPAIVSWRELGAHLDEAMPPSLLAEARPLRQWALLRPAAFAPARFDPVRQLLQWPLLDADGTTLLAMLPWHDGTRAAIRRIEGLDSAALAGAGVVAHLRRTSAAVIAEPLSLLRPATAQPVDCLHFADAADTPPAKWTSADANAPPSPTAATTATIDLPPALRHLRTLVQQLAERGVPPATERASLPALTSAIARAADAGFDAFPRTAANPPAALPQQLLRVHYAILQYERLMAPAVDDPADPGGGADEA
jgi:hypothetical protein